MNRLEAVSNNIDLVEMDIARRMVSSSQAFLQKISEMPFTPLQYKLIATYLAALPEDCDELPVFAYRTQQLAAVANLNDKKNIYSAVRTALQTLKMDLDISDGDRKGDFVEVFHTRVYDERRGVVKIGLDQRLKPHVLNISRELKSEYLLNDLFCLRESYTISLFYFLCIHATENESVVYLDLDTVREICLGDKAETKYKLYSHFNNRILKPSIERINKNTHVQIKEAQRIPATGKVKEFRFVIKLNNDPDPQSFSPSAPIDPAAITFMNEKGVDLTAARAALKELPLESQSEQIMLSYVEKAYQYTVKRSERNDFDSSKGLSAYFLMTVKNNYHGFKEREALFEIERNRKAKLVKLESRLTELTNRKAMLMDSYSEDVLLKYIGGLSDSARQKHFDEFNLLVAEGQILSAAFDRINANNFRNIVHFINFKRYLVDSAAIAKSQIEPTAIDMESYAETQGVDWEGLEKAIGHLNVTVANEHSEINDVRNI